MKATGKSGGLLGREKTAFVMVDVQEKLLPAMHDRARLLKNASFMLQSAGIMGVPVIATEQYPKGLGGTVKALQLPPGARHPAEKMHFSCFCSPEFERRLRETGAKAVVIFGIEAHVCVLQTALDALDRGYDVRVVADAVSSRTAENKALALERMRQSGILVESTEMVLFQMLQKAGTDEFRKVSALVK